MKKQTSEKIIKRSNPIAKVLRFLKAPYPIKPKKGKGSYKREKFKLKD